MSNKQTVSHFICEATGKRSFTEHDADKALGRAQSKRRRRPSIEGPKIMESRYYYCSACDGYHLTHMSRREFAALGLASA